MQLASAREIEPASGIREGDALSDVMVNDGFSNKSGLLGYQPNPNLFSAAFARTLKWAAKPIPPVTP
jgi:hypothetical protein